jgi:hypothetical protein
VFFIPIVVFSTGTTGFQEFIRYKRLMFWLVFRICSFSSHPDPIPDPTFSHPGSGFKHFFISDPGSYMKSGMHSYRYFFLAFYAFRSKFLVYAFKSKFLVVAKQIRDPKKFTLDPGSNKAPNPGSATLLVSGLDDSDSKVICGKKGTNLYTYIHCMLWIRIQHFLAQ